MDFFVENPGPAFIVGFAFSMCFLAALAARAKPAWPLALPALAWLAYGAWEAHLRGKGYNIRVDLLLIHPALAIITVASLALLPILDRRRRSKPGSDHE